MQDQDTFESIAYKYYGDASRYWIILFANLILDPNYQAPLNYSEFENYINSKYESAAAAQSLLDHYEKIVKTISRPPGSLPTTTTSVLFYANTTYSITDDVSGAVITNLPTIEHPTLQLTSPPSVNVDGVLVSTDITLYAVSAYDTELRANESKRNIQLPKKEYATSIEKQLLALLQQ
jgi:hypothetical protein